MKLNFTLVFLIFSVFALKAQDVTINTEQSTLLVKKTATWCPFCGQYGWTMMKGIMEDNNDKAVIVGAHHSGNLMSSTAADLMNHYGGSGQPVFFQNRTNLRVNSGNVSSKRTEVKNIVDNNYATTARIGVGVRVEDDKGVFNIDVKTEFLEEVTGDFNIAVWIVENDVQQSQSGRSGLQDHPNVLRDNVNGTFGEVLATGTTSAGTINDFSFTYTPDPSYKLENLRFVAVIWEDKAGSYSFENGFVQDKVEISTSSTNLSEENAMTLTSTILTDYTNVTINMKESQYGELQVVDLLGNQVLPLHRGVLASGQTQFAIQKGDLPVAGMYLVNFQTEEGQRITKRLLVK